MATLANTNSPYEGTSFFINTDEAAILYKEFTHSCNVRFQEAISRLNMLQSNAMTIQLARKKPGQGTNLVETATFMERCKIKLDDVDKLNVIHVSGTKGKGST
uniref:Folylpoly-gamma-glutamate synthetase n=1 Tax=Parascaris equorum TaxID=6256 RepID=A0A914RJJ5_PAREQ